MEKNLVLFTILVVLVQSAPLAMASEESGRFNPKPTAFVRGGSIEPLHNPYDDFSVSVMLEADGRTFRSKCDLVLGGFSRAVRAAEVMQQTLQLHEALLNDVDAANGFSAEEKALLGEMNRLWKVRTHRQIVDPVLVRRMLSRRDLIRAAPRLQQVVTNEAIAVAKMISEEFFLTALDYAIQEEANKLITLFVAFDQERDAAEVMTDALVTLHLWASNPGLYDLKTQSQKDQVNALDRFYQARVGLSLFTPSHLMSLLSSLDLWRSQMAGQKVGRAQQIAGARQISEDLFQAALAYLNSPETFFGKTP